nr:type I polyketide synthase [Nocardia wallacei]
MRCGVLPATLHVDPPSSEIDWDAGTVRLLSSRREWVSSGRPRRAGVSSFGISGTNAHVILEQAPPPAPDQPADTAQRQGEDQPADTVPTQVQVQGQSTGSGGSSVLPWVLSARSPAALTAQATRLLEFLQTHPDVDPRAVAATLARRTVFEHRAVLIGADRDELESRLQAFIADEPTPGVVVGRAGTESKTVFVFPGQGSQWLGMGRELYDRYPTFAAAFDAVARACDGMLDQPLRDVVWGENAEVLNSTLYAQPGLFAVEVGLCALLAECGIAPDVVLGHSLGEITAAHIAGVLDLPGAVALVMGRARLMSQLPAGGAMVAVRASVQDVAPLLVDTDVSLAAVNGPAAVVISGPGEAVAGIASRLGEQGFESTSLAVSHAFHSVLMQPMLAEFAEIVSRVTVSAPVVGIVSNLDGQLHSEGFGAGDYWVRHVRETVRFADSMHTLAHHDPDARVIEVGPGALTPLIREVTTAPVAVALLRRRRDAVTSVLESLAAAFVTGVGVQWRVLAGEGELVDVPPYAFERKRYWLDAPGVGDARGLGQSGCAHPVLGAVVESPTSGEVLFTGRLSVDSHGWVKDHAVGSVTLIPGAALAEWVLFAGDRLECNVIRELVLQAPLVVPERGGVDIRVVVAAVEDEADGGRRVEVFSRPEHAEGRWNSHAQGVVGPDTGQSVDAGAARAWPPVGADRISVDGFYQACAEQGYHYGPVFQGLKAVWRSEGEVFAELALPHVAAGVEEFLVHPALLDAAMQAIGFLDLPLPDGQVLLPFAWEQVRLHALGARHLRARLRVTGAHRIAIALHDGAENPVAEATLTVRGVGLSELQTIDTGEETLYTLDWKPTTLLHDSPGSESRHVLRYEWQWNDDLDDLRKWLHRIVEDVRSHLRTADPQSTIVVVTEQLIRVVESDGASPGGESAWGLLRSVQNEYPDRIVLVDTDDWDDTALSKAIGSRGGTQVAVRGHRHLSPRIHPVSASGSTLPSPLRMSEKGTVLITGGTGVVGASLARHLVVKHGASRILLLSRTGSTSAASISLCEELRSRGAAVDSVACDVSDRASLRRVLDMIPGDAPLVGVIHAAGVLADSSFDELTGDDLDNVLGAKAGGAWNLHELTADAELAFFIMCSSLSAAIGTPGQAGYAAANGFLDGLADYRRTAGLPAASIAWGLWESTTGMGSDLLTADNGRLDRWGIGPMSAPQALTALDHVLTSDRARTVIARLDLDRLRTLSAKAGMFAMFGDSSRGANHLSPSRRVAEGDSDLLAEVSAMTPEQRLEKIREVVLDELSVALGFSDPSEIDPRRSFQDLGVDSLSAMEFRNGISAVTGIRISPSAVFDYETPDELIDYINELLPTLAGGVT